MLFDLARSVNVWQTTLAAAANSSVGIIRALEDVTISAICALLAEAERSKSSADRRRSIDPHVSIATSWVGTLATLEMQTSRDFLGGNLMREIARLLRGTSTSLEVSLADGHLGRIVNTATRRAFMAFT